MEIMIIGIIFMIVILFGVLGFTVFFHIFKTSINQNITRENEFSNSEDSEDNNENPIKYE